MPTRPAAVRALLWVLAFAGAVGASVLLAGPLTLALRALGMDAEMGAVFRRTLLVAVLAVLVVGLHPWKDCPPGKWGLHGPGARPRDAFLGLALAFALLGALTAFEALAGWITWDHGRGWQKFGERLPVMLGGAAMIAVLEEFFFRGWMLARFHRRLAPFAAALATAALFALPHLLKETNAPKGLSADPAGALAALDAWARSAIDLPVTLPKMFGMLLFGLALAACLYRTRSLWLGIGLHAGAVFYVQSLSALTERSPERNWAGSKWLYDGPPGWVLIALLAFLLWPRHGAAPAVEDPPDRPATR